MFFIYIAIIIIILYLLCKGCNMFILEKYDTLDVVDVGSSYYADVIFKNDFLDTFQQLLDECKEKNHCFW